MGKANHSRYPVVAGTPYEKLPFGTDGPRGEMYLEVDALMAQEFLDHSKGNRRIRDEYVQELAREMRAGTYSAHARGKPFKFDEQGFFRDGHHTAFAVIEAFDATDDQDAVDSVPAGVVWGLTEEEVRQIDRNKPRTYKDILDVSRVPDADALATLVNASINWDQGYRVDRGHYKPSVEELDARLEEEKELFQRAVQMAKPILTKRGHRGIYTPRAVRFHLYLLLKLGDAAEEFLGQWVAALENDTEPWVTRNVLGTMTDAKTSKYRNSPYTRYGYQLGLLNEAWNRFVSGSTKSAISLSMLTAKVNSSKTFPIPVA